MPRFIGRPVVVEAHQLVDYNIPSAFSFAVKGWLPTGEAAVATPDGTRPCKYGDWILRGPDGTFSVMRNAQFEAFFEPQVFAEAAPVDEPERVKRAYTRRNTTYA